MNRREVLVAAAFIPFITKSPNGMVCSDFKLQEKKDKLCELIKDIYGMEVNAKELGNIRLWKLGHIGPTIETSILPTKQAIDKLKNIIRQIPSDSKFDIIWGPELDCRII